MKRKIEVCKNCQHVQKDVVNIDENNCTMEGGIRSTTEEKIKTTIAYSCGLEESDRNSMVNHRRNKQGNNLVSFHNRVLVCTRETMSDWEKADVPKKCAYLMEYNILNQNLN